MIVSSALPLVALGAWHCHRHLKYQSLRTRWRRYQESQVADHGERIKNARAKDGAAGKGE